MFQHLKIAITKPNQIYQSRKMSNGHFIGILLLILLFRIVLFYFNVFPTIHQIDQDTDAIAEKIPEFTTENGVLEANGDGFAYHTDTLLFFFNPDGQITQNEVEQNASLISNNNTFTVAFMPEYLYIDAILNSQQFSYSSLPVIEDEFLILFLEAFGQISALFLVFFTLALIFSLGVPFLLKLFFIGGAVYLSTRYWKAGLGFGEVLKMLLLSAIIPTGLIALINAFNIYIPGQIIIRSIAIIMIMMMNLRKLRPNQIF